MVLTVAGQRISRIEAVNEPVMRTFGALEMSGRPGGIGWTTDQAWFYTLEKDSHRYTDGNGFGSSGEGIGSEAYVYPGEEPDRGGALTVFGDDVNTFFPRPDTSTTIKRTAWAISDRVEIHQDRLRIGGPQHRFVQVLNSTWPGLGDPSRLIVAHGFMSLMGTMTQDAAVIELGDGGEAHDVAVAMFNPDLVTTPTAAIWNDGGTLYAAPLTFPRTDNETVNYQMYDHPPDVTVGTPVIIATGLATVTTASYRGVEAVSLGNGRVLVVTVSSSGGVDGHILTLTASGAITSTTTPLSSGAVQLQGIVRHDTSDAVLVPVAQGTNVEILLLATAGATPSVTASKSIAGVKGWVTWCGDTPVCSALSSGGIATIRTLTAALADRAALIPNTVAWEFAALYGRPDGRLLVAGSGNGVDGTTPPGESWDSLTEGSWRLYHVDDGAFTLVDQVVPSSFFGSSRRGDHVVPIDDDTALINDTGDHGGIVSLAGVFHSTWMTTLYPWSNTRVIEINPAVSGGDWVTPYNDFYTSMRVLEFNSRGVPTRVTRRAHPLFNPDFFCAAVALDDNRFLVAGVGELTRPAVFDSRNHLQVWEVTDAFELAKISDVEWDASNTHAVPWMVKLDDGRIAYAARYSSTQLIFALIEVDGAGTPTVVASQLVTPTGGVSNNSFNEQHPYRLFLVAENTLVLLYENNTVGTVVMKVTVSGSTFTAEAPALGLKLGNAGARDNHPCQIGSSIYHLVKYNGSGVATRWGIPNPGTGFFVDLAYLVKIDLDDAAPGGLSGTLLTPDVTAVPPSVDSGYEDLRERGVVFGFNDGVLVPVGRNQIAMLGGASISLMGDGPLTATVWEIDATAGTFVYLENSETAYAATERSSYPWNGAPLGDDKACFVAGVGPMYGRGAPYGYNENGYAGTVRVLMPGTARGTAVVGPQTVRVSTEGRAT